MHHWLAYLHFYTLGHSLFDFCSCIRSLESYLFVLSLHDLLPRYRWLVADNIFCTMLHVLLFMFPLGFGSNVAAHLALWLMCLGTFHNNMIGRKYFNTDASLYINVLGDIPHSFLCVVNDVLLPCPIAELQTSKYSRQKVPRVKFCLWFFFFF